MERQTETPKTPIVYHVSFVITIISLHSLAYILLKQVDYMVNNELYPKPSKSWLSSYGDLISPTLYSVSVLMIMSVVMYSYIISKTEMSTHARVRVSLAITSIGAVLFCFASILSFVFPSAYLVTYSYPLVAALVPVIMIVLAVVGLSRFKRKASLSLVILASVAFALPYHYSQASFANHVSRDMLSLAAHAVTIITGAVTFLGASFTIMWPVRSIPPDFQYDEYIDIATKLSDLEEQFEEGKIEEKQLLKLRRKYFGMLCGSR